MSDEYVREEDRISMTSISESEASYQTQYSANSESRPNPVNYDRTTKRRRSILERGYQPPFVDSAIILWPRRRNVKRRQESRVHDVLPIQESWREPTPTRRQAKQN